MKNGFSFILTAFFLITVSEAQVHKNHNTANSGQYYDNHTRELVALVKGAAALVRTKGETAFGDFRKAGSRWRKGETYIFVLDTGGNMLVHPDPELEGRNQLNLKDINGKPIIRGLLEAATASPGKHDGWYHYQWPVPGGLLPRWKSSFVQFVKAPSGKGYIVGSGMYNDRMERAFVIDAVKNAVEQVEKDGDAAFRIFHDPTSPFIAKDAYIFVVDPDGIELVNPAFPTLEGRNVLDVKDTRGKHLVREMLRVVRTSGKGWVDYMWPKPGESVSTRKSTYVSKAKMGNKWVLVACGVYLADAPKTISKVKKMTAAQLKTLVLDAAAVFEKRGEKAYPEFRKKGTKWFHDDVYFFAWTLDGVRTFHAANPAGEGMNVSDSKDVLGRPWGKMFLDAAASPGGEGWVHYMYPLPGDIFPAWKSSFVKRVTFPSGKQYLVGCGIYNMDMNKGFIEDVVNHAATLIAQHGKEAFDQLRAKTGPFIFMATYVFVDNLDGTELVNGAQPSIEGKNLMDLRDLQGKAVERELINVVTKKGSGWVEYYWYQPGGNAPALKQTYVRKAQFEGQTYIIGSGLYIKK
ncbi:MAG: cache domain-containing protein [Sphingobacteriales bacterium]